MDRVNWEKNFECWDEHRLLMQEAVEFQRRLNHEFYLVDRYYKRKVSLDSIKGVDSYEAAINFAVSLGKDPYWLLLTHKNRVTKEQVVEEINNSKMRCVKCGGRMIFSLTETLCQKANKNRYRGIFSCSNCTWHFFSRSTEREILDAVRNKDLSKIDIIEAIVNG